MSFRLGANASNNLRAAATNGMTACPNLGSTHASAQMLIYTGTQPTDPQTAASGTLLATINFANPAFGSADSTGTAGLAGGTAISATVAASGTAGWFRVVDRDSNPLFDGACGTSGADLNFDNTAFVAGGTVTVSALTIQTPL